MNLDCSNLNTLWASLMVEEFIRNRVDHFYLSPGSRCAPLTTAIARHPQAKLFMHFDERGSAFQALGYARACRKPAVWVTTSGTAVAHGLPAVIEAAAEHLPLIACTADRPPELRDCSANQTIRQPGLFGEYAQWFFDLPCPTADMEPAFVLTTADHAVMRSTAGPVHLNCMYREPLTGKSDAAAPAGYLDILSAWKNSDAPYTQTAPVHRSPDPDGVKSLAESCKGTTRGVILAGRLTTELEREEVIALAERLGWPIWPDITSGLRLGHNVDLTVSHYDQLLLKEDWIDRQHIQMVLQVGGRITSKRAQQFLQQHPSLRYVVVNPWADRHDPNHRVTDRFSCAVSPFCREFARYLEPDPDPAWRQAWSDAETACEASITEPLNQETACTEPGAARAVSELISPGHGLVLAASMPVRDMDMYASRKGAMVHVAANRGASGIDGTLATAAGFAEGLGQPVTVISGDLALLHDLNSLDLIRRSEQPIVVVVINNHGGGIFSFLPVAEETDLFESCFGTPHDHNFEHAARQFNLPYNRPGDMEAFTSQYRQVLEQRQTCLIEVVTDRDENKALHDALQQAVRGA